MISFRPSPALALAVLAAWSPLAAIAQTPRFVGLGGSIDTFAQISRDNGETQTEDPATFRFTDEELPFQGAAEPVVATSSDPDSTELRFDALTSLGSVAATADAAGESALRFSGSLNAFAEASARPAQPVVARTEALALFEFELFGLTDVLFVGAGVADTTRANVQGMAVSTVSILGSDMTIVLTAQQAGASDRLGAGTYFVRLQAEAFAAAGPGDPGAGRFGAFSAVEAAPSFDLTLTAVPEPSTAAVLGLGGLALLRRRRPAA